MAKGGSIFETEPARWGLMTVVKPEWGSKHVCQSCGTKYYDLQKSPIVCPKCGAEFDPDALLKSRKGRSLSASKAEEAEAAKLKAKKAAEAKAKAKAAEEEEADDDLEDVEVDVDIEDDDEEDDALIEDASELGEDDDDVAVVTPGDDKDDV